MSVSFSIRGLPLDCRCGHAESMHRRMVSYERRCTSFGCGCDDYDIAASEPFMNVSNDNALEMLRLCDINPYAEDGSLCGEWIGPDLTTVVQRILFVIASVQAMPELDPERPVTIDDQPGKCKVVHVGRRAGYMEDRLAKLLQIVDYAGQRGLSVTYG